MRPPPRGDEWTPQSGVTNGRTVRQIMTRNKRYERAATKLKDRGSWSSDGKVHNLPGGRDCFVCGRVVTRAIVLVRTEGPGKGVKQYAGERCALNALCFSTGGLNAQSD